MKRWVHPLLALTGVFGACVLGFLLAPAPRFAIADPPPGPAVVTQQAGTNVVSNTRTLNFASGCTVSASSGTTAAVTCGSGGTVTSVACGSGLTCTPSPIVGAGTVSLTSNSTTVNSQTCTLGSSCTVPAVTSISSGTGVTMTPNPTTTTGTAAVDQSFTPTWTGAHIWQTNAVGTAQTVQGTYQNTTAAAAGAQQYSPVLEFEGRGWKTNATAASQTVKMGLQLRPVQGAAAPTSRFDFCTSINGVAYSCPLAVADTGYLYFSSTVYLQGSTDKWLDGGTTRWQFGLGSSAVANLGTTDFSPQTDNGYSLGTTAKRYTGVYAMQYASASQTLAWNSATPTAIAPSSGNICLITITANVTAWSIDNGIAPGQIIVLRFLQGAAGPWTLGADSNAANILVAGGSFVLSVAAAGVDTISFAWDGTNWNEVGRGSSLSR